MTHNLPHVAKAMTAIAALLAFSATPLLAQDTTTPPDTAVDTSVETPATADPLAPEPAAEVAAPPAPQPKVETTTTRTERATRSASRATPRSTARRASAAAPAAPAVTASAPAAEAAAPAPLPAEPQPPVITEPAAPMPAAEPAPAGNAPDALMGDLMANSTLPIAGAAALGLLALGGAGLVARRRRRRRENEEFEARQQALDMIEQEPALELDPADEVRPGPVLARASAPIHDPVPAARQPLPSGFDPSRFGRHVQAAYRGPTADNPSVSLEYRLRRAAMLDEEEGTKAQARIPVGGDRELRSDGDFMLRRAGKDATSPVEPE